MARRMSAREARSNFSDLLGAVFYTNEAVIIERKGKPFGVVISPEQYRIMEVELQQAWRSVDAARARNAAVPQEEVLEEVTAEVEAVREEMQVKRGAPKSSR